MTTIIEEAQSQRRSEAASRPKRTRPAHHTRVSIVRWYASSQQGMCGRTRRAKRRSKGDSSDELDFVAIAYCSLCISKTPSPLIRESAFSNAKLRPRVGARGVRGECRRKRRCSTCAGLDGVQEKNFSWRDC